MTVPVLLTMRLSEFILDEYVEKLNVKLARAFTKEVHRAKEVAETIVSRTGADVADQVRSAGVQADLARVIEASAVLATK